MNPKIVMLVLFCLIFGAAEAQTSAKPLDPVKDRKEKDGYVIQLNPAPQNTILFDILKDGAPVFNQPMNPVTLQPPGFESREDAWKLAEWMIGQYAGQGKFPAQVPPQVALQLNVKLIRTPTSKQHP